MYCQFWSRDKDGGRTNRSALKASSMLHANLMSLCFIEPELWFYIAGIKIFNSSCSCDLDLDPMTFTYELDSYSLILWRYTGRANMNFLHQGFRKLSSDRQTDKQTDIQTLPKLYTMPLCGWSINMADKPNYLGKHQAKAADHSALMQGRRC